MILYPLLKILIAINEWNAKYFDNRFIFLSEDTRKKWLQFDIIDIQSFKYSFDNIYVDCMNEYRICAWPSRLEALFNQVLFQGEEVVKVSNLAVGGANSEVGKTLLEYQLFDDSIREQLPHIVIWAVSILLGHSLFILLSIQDLHLFLFL